MMGEFSYLFKKGESCVTVMFPGGIRLLFRGVSKSLASIKIATPLPLKEGKKKKSKSKKIKTKTRNRIV